jgi:epoxyqueuosine reductase QueG
MGCVNGDKTSCLSALTQKKGALTEAEQKNILSGGLVWGCDACQLACPHNQRVIAQGIDTPISYFREARNVRISTPLLNAMDNESFASRAYAWRGKAVIVRNTQLLEEHADERRTP